MEQQGIDPVTASEMVGWTFDGIAGDAKDLCSSPHGFDELIAEQVSPPVPLAGIYSHWETAPLLLYISE